MTPTHDDSPDASAPAADAETAPAPTALQQWTSVVPVWIVAGLGAVLIGVYSPPAQYFTWLPIVLAVATFLSFCIQLAMQRKEGLVLRIAISLTGAVVLLSIATLVLGPLALVQGAVTGQ